MSARQATLFEGARASMHDSIADALGALRQYGPRHSRWACGWSWGKDSTATLTFVVWAITTGQVPAPKSLTVLSADTRVELPPLAITAATIRDELEEHREALAARGCDLQVETVVAPIPKRFWPYQLGLGVPPPNNGRLRWCTRQIKVDPMHEALARLGGAGEGKFLMLTGVRQGESAARDDRIALSCSKDGGECGQGWYQTALPEALCATLAPILRWRICHVWQWLDGWAPLPEFGEWSTRLLAAAYGGRDGDEAAEIAARTGCTCCPLASKDSALLALLKRPEWSYLRPLLQLRAMWEWLRRPGGRLRKAGGEARADGKLAANQHRLGPLTIERRQEALTRVLSIQTEVNAAADLAARPRIDILNDEEIAYIRGCHAKGVWPEGWEGDEAFGDEPFEEAGQLLLPSMLVRGRP